MTLTWLHHITSLTPESLNLKRAVYRDPLHVLSDTAGSDRFPPGGGYLGRLSVMISGVTPDLRTARQNTLKGAFITT